MRFKYLLLFGIPLNHISSCQLLRTGYNKNGNVLVCIHPEQISTYNNCGFRRISCSAWSFNVGFHETDMPTGSHNVATQQLNATLQTGILPRIQHGAILRKSLRRLVGVDHEFNKPVWIETRICLPPTLPYSIAISPPSSSPLAPKNICMWVNRAHMSYCRHWR